MLSPMLSYGAMECKKPRVFFLFSSDTGRSECDRGGNNVDELLLRRARKGDAEAFEQLMTPLEGLIWRVCWHYTGNREDASDCAQEAMVKIWRSLASFRFDCSFETWAYRIAANCSLDFLRKARRNVHVSLEPLADQGFDPPDPGPGTEEAVLRKDEHARLRQAIAQLPEEQRDALVLTQLEGKSYEEVSQMMNISEGTVKSRVNRARNRLRELFSGDREPFSRKSVQTDAEGSGRNRKSSEKKGARP